MKKKIEKDERVLAKKRKIGNDAFQILYLGLLAAILIQQYAFKASFSQYAGELILLVVLIVYVLARNLMVGHNIFPTSKKGQMTVVVYSLVCGVIVSVIVTVLNYMRYGDKVNIPIALDTTLVAVIVLAISFVFSFIVLELLYLTNKKKQNRINSQLDEDE